MALILLAVLTATTFPLILQQIQKAEVGRVLADLTSVESGVRTFMIDARPGRPYELEQLTRQITVSDQDLDGNLYTAGQASRWNGPYLDRIIPPATGDAAAFETGFTATIHNRVVFFSSISSTVVPTAESADWIAIRVDGLNGDEFEAVNAAYEGHEPPGFDPGQSWFSGTWRWDPPFVIDPGFTIAPAYFLIVRI